MKPLLILVLTIGTSVPLPISAQGLRKGHAHDQEAARKELAGLQAATPDLGSWEKRKATVKAGILAGAKLTTLPERTPSTHASPGTRPQGLSGRERRD